MSSKQDDAGPDSLAAQLDDATRLLRLHAGDTELRHRRGLLRKRLGDLTGAIADFSDVIAANPGHHLARVNRGVVHFEQAQYPLAISEFDDALMLDPLDALTLNDRGAAHRSLRHFDAALADFTAAVRINSELLAPRINAALVLMDQSRYPEVISVCTEGLRALPDSPDLQRLMDEAATRAGHPDIGSSRRDQWTPSVETEPESGSHGAVFYAGRDGFGPKLTEEVLDAVRLNDAPFADETEAGDPPTVKFCGQVRYVRIEDFDRTQSALFQFAFPGFFGSASTPADVALESRLQGKSVESPFNYRRYAGDTSLPRGCYFALDRSGTTSGDGTLAREMLAYAETSRTGELDAVDLSNPEAAGLRRAYAPFFGGGSVPESAIVLRFMSRPGRPSPAHDLLDRIRADFDSPIVEATREFPVFIPTRTATVAVDGVMDLRTREAREWLLRALTTGLPTLDYAYSGAGRSRRLFLRGRAPTTFDDLLPLLLCHFRGGSPILDGIAAHLRSVGVQGFIYPSARCDSLVRVLAGKVDAWSGWSLVDYRDAPRVRPARRVVVDPDSWAETSAPLTVRLAPEDHPAAGSFAVEGNVDAIAGIRSYETELYYQRGYFAGEPEAFAPRFAIRGVSDRMSMVEVRSVLAIGVVSLSSVVTMNDGSESTVGEVIAATIAAPPQPYLQPQFRADRTWFVYRVGTWDAELLIHCAVCDHEDLWPLHMGEQGSRCPECRFAGEGSESPAEVRSRLLGLFGN